MCAMKLDLGSGHSRKDGYLRVDADPKCAPDILCDVSNIATVKEGSVDEVYSAHVLEHFDPEDTFRVLREWWRVLRPGGRLEIKVPDAGWAFKAWSEGEIRDCCLMRAVFGSDPKANDFMRHKNLFHASRLDRFLFITGYAHIENLTRPGSGELHFEAYRPLKSVWVP